MSALPRFRFAEFTISPRQRLVWQRGVPVALIPKYFDLLLLLISRRHEAVSKNVIFSQVWTDVIVSDGALAQAIRTIRRTLGDDPREPRFIRTVHRHGYQFVWPEVFEEADAGPVASPATPPPLRDSPVADATDAIIDRLLTVADLGPAGQDEARDLAERLHAAGTSAAIVRLQARPRHAAALAYMREARWSIPEAGAVPMFRDPEWFAATRTLIGLRLRDVRQTVAQRWAGAAAAGGLAGAIAGLCGGMLLYAAPGSSARPQSSLALAAIGAVAGSTGAAGIGAGLTVAEVLARSYRRLALTACGGIGGAVVAWLAELLVHALLEGLFGLQLLRTGGALDGLLLGAAAGLGYAIATPQGPGGGIAAPPGARRLATAAIVGTACAVAAVLLSLLGRPMIGGLVHEIAQSSREAQLGLAPLGHLLGEPGFGRVTRLLLSAYEGGTLGASLAWGLTRRPRSTR